MSSFLQRQPVYLLFIQYAKRNLVRKKTVNFSTVVHFQCKTIQKVSSKTFFLFPMFNSHSNAQNAAFRKVFCVFFSFLRLSLEKKTHFEVKR